MKVNELIEALQKCNPELDVVLTITDTNDESKSYDSIHIDMGWEPSGVLSIESNSCILE